MVITHFRSKRKRTGGRFKKPYRSKRKYETGSAPMLTGLSKTIIKTTRKKGGRSKTKLFSADIANVYDPKTKKYVKAAIKNILENPANRHFVRRNIMTKGTIIDTEKGKARITSRPGQTGTVNAILV